MSKLRLTACAAILIAMQAKVVWADVRLPAIIGSNMVLQAGKPVPIWGWADPNEKVTVSFGDQHPSAVAGADGKWRVTLEPLHVGEAQKMTVTGKNALALDNVLVGSVWVCSGQSNMAFGMGSSHNANVEIPKANYPTIRLFNITLEGSPEIVSAQPLSDCKGEWVECTPQEAARFSAVGYFFGRDVHLAENIPVGLIHASQSGTNILSWISLSALEKDPALKSYADSAKADIAHNNVNHYSPIGNFNGKISPLIPFAVQGVIWYQGENNVGGPEEEYRLLFRTMIADWREKWGEGDFPFLYVQLANIGQSSAEPSESMRALVRDAQLKSLALPNTGMAVTIDLGEVNEHPHDKSDVGHRLALAAEKVAFHRDIVSSGPLFEDAKIEGSRVRIRFTSVGGGLVIGSPPPIYAPPPKPLDHLVGFSICGQDRTWVWADARIEGDTVVVSSDQVPHPVAVRYAWADNPQCNLYNKEGLPASPFRTDSFEK